MPLVRAENAGGITVASASTVLRLTVSLTADAAFRTVPLQVEDMPRLFFYMRHTSAAAGQGVSYNCQFAVSDEVSGGQIVPEWLDFQTGVLPFNVPVLLNYELPAKFIRLSLTRVAGSANQTVEIAIGGTQ
jgi:hypothetical protein